MAKKAISGRPVLLGSHPEMTKAGERGCVVGFRPRTCVRALSQDGRQVVLPPLSLMPLAKLPVFRAALPLPGLTQMPYETGLCPDAVGCGLWAPLQARPAPWLSGTWRAQLPGNARYPAPTARPPSGWERLPTSQLGCGRKMGAGNQWLRLVRVCPLGLSVSPHHALGFPVSPLEGHPLRPHRVCDCCLSASPQPKAVLVSPGLGQQRSTRGSAPPSPTKVSLRFVFSHECDTRGSAQEAFAEQLLCSEHLPGAW